MSGRERTQSRKSCSHLPHKKLGRWHQGARAFDWCDAALVHAPLRTRAPAGGLSAPALTDVAGCGLATVPPAVAHMAFFFSMGFRSSLARSHRQTAREHTSACLITAAAGSGNSSSRSRCAAHLLTHSPPWRAVPTLPWSAAIRTCSSAQASDQLYTPAAAVIIVHRRIPRDEVRTCVPIFSNWSRLSVVYCHPTLQSCCTNSLTSCQ